MIAEGLQYLAAFLLLIGAVFGLLAAVGVLRLPDLLTRMHAASKAGVVGVGLILLAIGFASLDLAVALRAILGLVFLVLTTPVSAHLLARAAVEHGAATLPGANISSGAEHTGDSGR
jgi:multicomponent Na+:H+ antiporter subunit G